MTEISGTITLDDGETVQFNVSTENPWNQWGNTTENLWRTVDVVEGKNARSSLAKYVSKKPEEAKKPSWFIPRPSMITKR